MAPARVALADRNGNPETRQFLIRAALKRANELNRLRELPDTPTRTEPPRIEAVPEDSKVAVLPADRSEADPAATAAIPDTPNPSVPVEIGEPSSTEMPVTKHEKPATAETPEHIKARRDIRRRAHRVRHPRPTIAAQPQQFNLFAILFGGQQYQYQPRYNPQQPAYATQQAGPQQQRGPGTQQAQQPVASAPQTQRQQFSNGAQPQAQMLQQPLGTPPTFGEQPAPQVQQPTRAVQRPNPRRSKARTGNQSAQSTANDPHPAPTY